MLEIYDLDGNLTTIDPLAAVIGQQTEGEVYHYIVGAAHFVSEHTGVPEEEVFAGIRDALLEIYPERAQLKYWGNFGKKFPIMPATDHMQLVVASVPHFLKKKLDNPATNPSLREGIARFIDPKWKYPLYKAASAHSLPHASLDEDGISVLDERLKQNARPIILSNSSSEKAETLLKRAGFGDYLEMGVPHLGKIGIIGNAQKFEVDESLPIDSASHVDLSRFGMDVQLDLRRRIYREHIERLLRETDHGRVIMTSDSPELDLYPLKNWIPAERLRMGMKINPVSAPESIAAARALLGAEISNRLSVLMEALLQA